MTTDLLTLLTLEFFIIPVDLSSCFISSSQTRRVPAALSEYGLGMFVL